MKHQTKILLLIGLILASCAPLRIYYKEGETVARMDRDKTDCDVSALHRVPTDLRSHYIPPVYRSYRVCHGNGLCHWHKRLVSPGRFEKFDANQRLRLQVSNQCMADLGYVRTDIKRCDTSTARTTDLKATRVFPRLTSQSCAIRLKSGRWQIVTPDNT